ncbi:MAG: hypothetical protein ACNS60_19730 [Candidatus Cyclobacteriaceae bacterium M2_1C_046]
MESINFNKNVTSHIFEYSFQPVINIIRVRLQTNAKDWIGLISSGRLVIKINALNNKDEVVSLEENSISLITYVTPQTKLPILEINKTFKFEHKPLQEHTIKKWSILLELVEIDFKNNDSLLIEYMDSHYIQKRVDDWNKRIKELIKTFDKWSNNGKEYSVEPSRNVLMNEEMMRSFNINPQEVESAMVEMNGKIQLVIKPLALWIIGANGRIDLLSKNGNYILVDTSEAFQEPKWKIFFKDDKRKSLDFNKEVLFKIIKNEHN